MEDPVHPIVYGPVDSRRYGRSLGVNPLPADVKYCNFDCGYCQLGWTDPERMRTVPFPTPEEVGRALAGALEAMRARGETLDHVCIAGNGEPTLHPRFDEVVERVLEARDAHFPGVRVSVLTNATTAHAPRVRAALLRIDEAVLKIDGGTPGTIARVDLPLGGARGGESPLDLDRIVEAVGEIPNATVQTMFVRGPVDNTTEAEIAAWIQLLRRCRPASVQIYSLDREAADPRLRPVPLAELEAIADRARRETGLDVQAY